MSWMRVLFALLLPLCGDGSYNNYRLEKLCPPDGSKVRLKLTDFVASFHLNSSLVPGSHFTCHVELILDSSKFGFFVYFDSMKISPPLDGECEMDYVQFGRDILFITSHRSNKFCGTIEGTLPLPPPRPTTTTSPSSNASLARSVKTSKDSVAGSTSYATPLPKRVYSEASDQEMDIWIQLAVPPADWPGHKTLSLTVTPFKKTCGKDDPVYRRCSSSSRTCVRKDLFCDGRINCALKTSKPPDETSCSLTASPPESESAMWEDAGLPHFAGLFFGIIFLLVLLTYVAKNFQQKAPKTSTISELDRRYERSLDVTEYDSGLIVPVDSNPTRMPRRAPPLPPSYTDSLVRDPPFAPGFSYSNR